MSSMSVSALVLVTSITLTSAASRHRQGLRAPPPSGRPLPSEQWFEQRLDHFRVTERRTWKQRWGGLRADMQVMLDDVVYRSRV